MTAPTGFDRFLEEWLVEGPSELSDGAASRIVQAIDDSQRRPSWLPWRETMNRMMLAVGGVAAAIVLIVGGGMLVGWGTNGLLGGQPSPTATPTPAAITTHEAVFLRRDPSSDILVLGVDSRGREREITRLPNAWRLPISRLTPAPAGVISSTGLLAMAVNGPASGLVRWTIYDLLQPDDPPIIIPGFPQQDIDQLDYFLVTDRTGGDARPWWGPDDQLAIYWFERIPQGPSGSTPNHFVTFADGKTGEATSVDIPDDWAFRPYWAPDGSGVFTETTNGLRVLRPDGTLAAASDPLPEASCQPAPEEGSADPATGRMSFACVSPDDVLVVITSGNASFPTGSVRIQDSGEEFEVEGSFAGWLPADR
jgi:hypothetical protein